MTARRLTLIGLDGIGEVEEGEDLATTLLAAVEVTGEHLQQGDVIVVAQKIVSKSEGRMVRLAEVSPSAKAAELSSLTGKDARLCHLILDEAREIMRTRKELIIVEDVRGFVLANAGIDASNVSPAGDSVLLLPKDPDASARHLRDSLADRTGLKLGIVIIDSIGRAWRRGTVGTAIGVAGIPALLDLRGRPDMHGRKLETSELGLADELAAAASLLMGQSNEGCPAVLIRGLGLTGDGSAQDLLRPRDMDLFR